MPLINLFNLKIIWEYCLTQLACLFTSFYMSKYCWRSKYNEQDILNYGYILYIFWSSI